MSLFNLTMQWQTSKRPELTLMIIGLMTWLQTLHGGFVHYDTPQLVVQNPILSSPAWSDLYTICCDLSLGARMELGAEYLPLRDLSVALDFVVFGENWIGHHFSNLLYYLMATWYFFQVLSHWLGRNWASWMGALLFLLHPTHVESVAWLASRKDVLSLLFFCLSIHALLSFKRPILWATIWGIAAYWSKNTAIALPPLLIWISLTTVLSNETTRLRWKNLLPWSPMALLFSIALGITLHIGNMVSMFAPQRGDGFLETASITLQAFGTYLTLLIVPSNLSVVYPEPGPSGLDSLYLWLGIGLITIGVWGVSRWKESTAMSAGGLTILLGLLPVSQIATIQNLMAERYLLVPSLGLCMMIAALLNDQRLGRVKWTFAATMATGFALIVLMRIPDWNNSIALWSAQTKAQPLVVRGWVALAGRHLEDTDFHRAEATYKAALTHLPSHPEIRQGQGLLHIMKGNRYLKEGELTAANREIAIAEEHLKEALNGDSGLRKAARNLIKIYLATQRQEKAVVDAEKLVSIHPLYADGWNVLTEANLAIGDVTRAKRSALKSQSIEPNQVKPKKHLAYIALQEGDLSQAKSIWEEILTENPNDVHALKGIEIVDREQR